MHPPRHALQLPQVFRAAAPQVEAQLAGYVVVAVGALMLALQLAGGLRLLVRRQWHLAHRLVAMLIYVGVSLHLVQLVVLFRNGL